VTSALMIVDVQQGMFALRSPLHRGEEVVRRIAGLLGRARAEGVPVVHIQHDGGPGHVLAKGGHLDAFIAADDAEAPGAEAAGGFDELARGHRLEALGEALDRDGDGVG